MKPLLTTTSESVSQPDMDQPSVKRTVTVVNPQGLHARPADLFVKTANRFDATVEVTKGSETVDGKSILSILTLAAEYGTDLEIQAIGADAEEALDALVALVEQGFEANDPSRTGNHSS